MRRGVRTLRSSTVIGLASALVAVTGSTAVVAVDEARLGPVGIGQRVVTGIVADLPALGDGPAIRRYHRTGQFAADRGLVASAARAALSAETRFRWQESPQSRCPKPMSAGAPGLVLHLEMFHEFPDFAAGQR